MKTRFWNSDWFAGLIITILVVVFSGSASFQSLERSAYDWGVKSTSRAASERIAIIAIDDASVANIGRWPWQRNLHASLIKKLSEAGAKVIGLTLLFSEPQIDPGTNYIRDLIDFYSNASFNDVPADIDELSMTLNLEADNEAVAKILAFYLQSNMSSRLSQDIETLKVQLIEAEQALNTDAKLAASMDYAKNVVLAMTFTPGEVHGHPDKELASYVLKNALPNIHDRVSAKGRALFPIPTNRASPPIPEIGQFASAIGHLNFFHDIDGGIRNEALVLKYYDRFYPSISLQIAAKSLNLDNNDIQINLAESVQLGPLTIETDSFLQMNTFYYADTDGFPAYQPDSYIDVITDKIPIEKYKDKIVLIGATTTGVGTSLVTPVNSAMPPVLVLAHRVSSILNEDFFIQPGWGPWIQICALILTGLYLMLIMPRLKTGVGFVLTLALLVMLVVAHYILMTSSTIWIPLMTPAVLLAIGYPLITTKRFLLIKCGRLKSDKESPESNHIPGIAIQGQLDSARWVKR